MVIKRQFLSGAPWENTALVMKKPAYEIDSFLLSNAIIFCLV